MRWIMGACPKRLARSRMRANPYFPLVALPGQPGVSLRTVDAMVPGRCSFEPAGGRLVGIIEELA